MKRVLICAGFLGAIALLPFLCRGQNTETHPLDEKESFVSTAQEFRKAAEQGNATAQYNLSTCYAKGEGVTQDIEEAVKWLRKAAEQGLAVAQCALGSCYAYGDGVTMDKGEAAKWFRKAAEQGDAKAQSELGA